MVASRSQWHTKLSARENSKASTPAATGTIDQASENNIRAKANKSAGDSDTAAVSSRFEEHGLQVSSPAIILFFAKAFFGYTHIMVHVVHVKK